ncbi:hypothetical protein GCM10010094_03920 [Streptomyces flaveus]|uniref:Uncharacterized protein n=1 Tax=Streptomyces flaveus TaxID=66370 RepID=A0A917QEU9_9ACTN|nr:hypothetical protein GCM10010094_03920 [Streptomyces flaveus]
MVSVEVTQACGAADAVGAIATTQVAAEASASAPETMAFFIGSPFGGGGCLLRRKRSQTGALTHYDLRQGSKVAAQAAEAGVPPVSAASRRDGASPPRAE